MPRGGRRPGAGAPMGNTNALRTGMHSRRVRAIIKALMWDPETRVVLLRLAQSTKARNEFARQLGMAMARFMHDQPVADEVRTQIERLSDAALVANETRNVQFEIALYEQQSRLDAYTGQPLTRRAEKTPAEKERMARILARYRIKREIADLKWFAEQPEQPHVFTSVLDDEPITG